MSYDSPQDRAEVLVPIGWCTVCIGEAKRAEAAGRPLPAIAAAVTAVPVVQHVGPPPPVVVLLPHCWARITVTPEEA